jgi:hypothetical protein
MIYAAKLTTRTDMTRDNELARATTVEQDLLALQDMPTARYPGVEAVRFCSGVSANQVCNENTTAAL